MNKIKFEESHCLKSVKFFPIAGLFYGCIYYFTSMLYSNLDFNIELVAFLIVGESFLLITFLHFDGYCDVCDAFLVNKDKAQRLEILKDSHVGSFALGSAVLLILLKFILVKIFLANNTNLVLLLIIPVITRFAFVFLSFISKYPREEGTGAFLIGKLKPSHLIVSFIVFIIILFFFFFFFCNVNLIFTVAIYIIIFSIVTVTIRFISNKKIGGVTGDVIGFTNEILFIALLSVPLIINYFGFSVQ